MLRLSVAGVLGLAALAPAAAASGWSQPEPLSQFDGDPGPPAIATGDSGGARAAWSQGGVFTSAERVPATPWSLPGTGGPAVSGELRLAPLGDSETLAVWAAPDGVTAAVRPDGGPWGDPQVIDPAGPAAVGLRLVSADGEAVAVWSSGAAGGIRTASYIDGDWEDVVVVSGQAPGVDPSVALDDDGQAIAVWRAGANQIAAAQRGKNGEWSEAEPVTAAGVPGRAAPQVALGADDTVLAAWREPGQIAAAARADDGTWTTPVGVATASRPATVLSASESAKVLGPQIVADGDGITAVWVEVATGRLLTRTRDAAGVWSDIIALSPARENAVEPRARVDGDGTLRVTWIQGSGTGTRVRATERTEGAGFSAAVNLSRRQGEVHDLSLSIADDGNALAAWLRDTAPGGLVVVARLRREAACASVPLRTYPAPGSGEAELSADQLAINQRISQAAVRRAAAIERWFDDGVVASDFCGAGIDHDDLGPSITRVFAGVPTAQAVFPEAEPRPVVVATAGSGGGTVTLDAGQLRINQKISQAAVRRINALTQRLDRGLTGGDVADGAIGNGQIDPVVSIVAATPNPDPPAASQTQTAPPGAQSGTIRLSAGQLRTNQRISQAAVRRANELLDRIATGLASGDIADFSLTADDLAADAVGG